MRIIIDMKLRVFDRQYNKYEWICSDGSIIDDGPAPLHFRLLDGDQYETNTIMHTSPYRTGLVTGILNLSGGTYGRYKGKLLYKCYPDCKGLPTFLIPYQERTTGFSKFKVDSYVQFEFVEWVDKHPFGKLARIIGPVTESNAFTEYMLLCKDVNHSNQKLNKIIAMSLPRVQDMSFDKFGLEDRTSRHVFAIDPPSCSDADDAMGIYQSPDGKRNIVTVYISAVPVWLDALNIWESFTLYLERVSTIYLHDERRHMLPTKLSEGLCSLNATMARPVLAMDILVEDGVTKSVTFGAAIVKLSRNYEYESKTLLLDNDYRQINRLINQMNKTDNYKETIKDSHDVVEYLMLMMNHRAGQCLRKERGLFRYFRAKNASTTMEAPEQLKQFVRTWGTEGGQYTTDAVSCKHDMMPDIVDVYAHVTSPIRRLADLVNMTILLEIIGIHTQGHKFVDRWLQRIDVLNARMKAVRQVQNEVALLHRCSTLDTTADMVDYEGFVVSVEPCPFQEGQFKHSVFIPELGCVGRLRLDSRLELYACGRYTVHVFHDSDSLRRKVRLHFAE